jgi:hypothetical protein
VNRPAPLIIERPPRSPQTSPEALLVTFWAAFGEAPFWSSTAVVRPTALKKDAHFGALSDDLLVQHDLYSSLLR